MKKLILVFVLFCTAMSVNAQYSFMRHYGDSSSNQAGYSVKQCFDGGYIACGYSSNYRMYVVRTDAMGDTLWTKTYYDWENRVAFDIIQTHDSCFVMCGYRNSSSPKVCLQKIDQNGDTLWMRQVGTGGWGQALQETPDHGFMIAGSRLYRTDSNGVLLWNGVAPSYQYMSIAKTSDGGYAMISGANSGNIYLTKTDSAGGTQW